MDDSDCKKVEALLLDELMEDDDVVMQEDIKETDSSTIEQSLQDSVSRFLRSIHAEQASENLRREQQDDPIDVDMDPEHEMRRRWLQVLDPVFRDYNASGSREQAVALEPAAMTKMEE
ncbi:hypothetical protein EWM64_g1264 [Hericium alpestre]|uniref:Uncharacterized protein n=1 Tax=Hericium alpestre TaxID=135208 RepID=A0A4Z0A6T8_9AGAM|nr:hypothetical protein EWM64_g1264 [Hericium alpestre]